MWNAGSSYRIAQVMGRIQLLLFIGLRFYCLAVWWMRLTFSIKDYA
jgi:hypothetical protein